MPTTPQAETFEIRFLLTQDNEVISIPQSATVELTFTKEGAASPATTLALGTDPELSRETLTAGEERGGGVVCRASPSALGLSPGQYAYTWTVSGVYEATQTGTLEVTPGSTHETRTLYERATRRIAELAKRTGDPVLAPNKGDYGLLRDWLKEAIHDVSTRTDRLGGSLDIELSAGQSEVDQPPELHTVLDAVVDDGTSATELEVKNGPETARAGRASGATEGRPCHLGQHGTRLFFYPVPDKGYTATIYYEYSGEPPADGTLADIVSDVPPELQRALVHYLVGEWLLYHGHAEIGGLAQQRYARDLRRHEDKPTTQTTAERPYNPLSL